MTRSEKFISWVFHSSESRFLLYASTFSWFFFMNWLSCYWNLALSTPWVFCKRLSSVTFSAVSSSCFRYFSTLYSSCIILNSSLFTWIFRFSIIFLISSFFNFFFYFSWDRSLLIFGFASLLLSGLYLSFDVSFYFPFSFLIFS